MIDMYAEMINSLIFILTEEGESTLLFTKVQLPPEKIALQLKNTKTMG